MDLSKRGFGGYYLLESMLCALSGMEEVCISVDFGLS